MHRVLQHTHIAQNLSLVHPPPSRTSCHILSDPTQPETNQFHPSQLTPHYATPRATSLTSHERARASYSQARQVEVVASLEDVAPKLQRHCELTEMLEVLK